MRQYIKIELKRLLLTLPGFFAALSGTLLFGLLTVFLALNFLPEVLEVEPFRVGLWVEEGDAAANYVSEYVKQMDSVKGLVEFREITSGEIWEAQGISRRKIQETMETEGLAACIIIPERTAQSIMDGTNIPVQVFVSGSADGADHYLQQRMLMLLTEYGAALIDVPQAETLLLYEMQIENPEETGRVLDLFHFGLVLERESWFEREYISAFGSMEMEEYYLGAGAALLLIFWGLGSGSFFRQQEKNLPLLLERRGIPLFFQQGVKQMLYIVLYLTPALLLSVGMRNVKMTVPVLLCSVMMSLQCSFFFELAPGTASGLVLNCIWGFAVFLGAGGVLPAVFLPKFLAGICSRLPAGICLEMLLQNMAGKSGMSGEKAGWCLLWCLVFGILGQLVFYRKQRSRLGK